MTPREPRWHGSPRQTRDSVAAFVDDAVAVVIDAVADLRRRRARRAGLRHPAHAVLDCCLAGPHTTGGRAEPLVHRTVAVVIDAVADLRRGRARCSATRRPAHALLARWLACPRTTGG